ncbi:hypothetical protein OHB00_26915 [Streptomyces sp. NBC_00631]|uniref:hypothetical protein n=1 Tax=Streptomyces sp. NBC_00631 TaxID=2975793 RepID=UPI0030E2C208
MVWSNLACALAEALAVVLLVSGAAQVWQLPLMAGVCGPRAGSSPRRPTVPSPRSYPPGNGTPPTHC